MSQLLVSDPRAGRLVVADSEQITLAEPLSSSAHRMFCGATLGRAHWRHRRRRLGRRPPLALEWRMGMTSRFRYHSSFRL
jgi:hypothetical protein